MPVCHVILLVPRSAVGATLPLKHRDVVNLRPSKEFVPLRQFLKTSLTMRFSQQEAIIIQLTRSDHFLANQNRSFYSQPEALISSQPEAFIC